MYIYYIYILFYILLIPNYFVLSFNLPPVFREWHCINFVKNIDTTKPYPFKIGELPLISWYDNKYNKTYTTVNICSHMGSKLDNSKINNGCLVCPYHGMLYSEEKAFGETIIYQDKLWWSYEPIAKKPPSIPFYNNKDYTTTNICIDIDANIMDCVLNIIDVNHQQYYNMLIPPKKIKKFKYFNNIDEPKRLSMGISFKNKVLSNNIKEFSEYNKYYNMYKFPYNAWTRILLPNKKQSIMNIDFLPLGIDKTRWFITMKNNRETNNIFTKPFMYYYTNQYKELLSNNQALHTDLKKLVIRQEVLANENHLDDIYDMFEKYKYPDNNMVCNLYKYHKKKINNIRNY
jgi:nitrite reductase/ring-hydroxylating ferredoxin subunit